MMNQSVNRLTELHDYNNNVNQPLRRIKNDCARSNVLPDKDAP